jgi:hypothetical protein
MFIAAIVALDMAGHLRASPDDTISVFSDVDSWGLYQTGNSGVFDRAKSGRSRAMSSSTRLADTIGAIAGVVFAILLFLSVAAVDPVRGVPDQELQEWWAEGGNRTGFITSMYILMVASPIFLLFVSRLRMRLRTVEASGWAEIVFALGLVTTTAIGFCAITRGIVASAIRFQDEPLPGVDTLRFATELSYAAWDLVILFMAVLVGSVSILALLAHALPRWVGWLGVPFSVAGPVFIALHMAPFSIPLFIIWIVATSVHLLRTAAAAQIETLPRATGLSGAQA